MAERIAAVGEAVKTIITIAILLFAFGTVIITVSDDNVKPVVRAITLVVWLLLGAGIVYLGFSKC